MKGADTHGESARPAAYTAVVTVISTVRPRHQPRIAGGRRQVRCVICTLSTSRQPSASRPRTSRASPCSSGSPTIPAPTATTTPLARPAARPAAVSRTPSASVARPRRGPGSAWRSTAAAAAAAASMERARTTARGVGSPASSRSAVATPVITRPSSTRRTGVLVRRSHTTAMPVAGPTWAIGVIPGTRLETAAASAKATAYVADVTRCARGGCGCTGSPCRGCGGPRLRDTSVPFGRSTPSGRV